MTTLGEERRSDTFPATSLHSRVLYFRAKVAWIPRKDANISLDPDCFCQVSPCVRAWRLMLQEVPLAISPFFLPLPLHYRREKERGHAHTTFSLGKKEAENMQGNKEVGCMNHVR